MSIRLIPSLSLLSVAVLLFSCSSSRQGQRSTNNSQPGPAVGTAIGNTVGAVGGNIAGGAVATGQGAADAAQESFNPRTKVIRRWHTETTIDGRVIQVPKDYLLDEQGHVIKEIPVN